MHLQIAVGVLCVLLALIAVLVGRLVYWHWVKKAPRDVQRVDGEVIDPDPDRDAIPPAYSALVVLSLFAVLVGLFIVLTV